MPTLQIKSLNMAKDFRADHAQAILNAAHPLSLELPERPTALIPMFAGEASCLAWNQQHQDFKGLSHFDGDQSKCLH